MKTQNILLVVLVTIFLSFPLQTFAKYCACCAEHGEYSISVKKPGDYELDELKRLQIATTNLYSDAGYPDNIMGLDPLRENYNASFILQPTAWKFDFSETSKTVGILNLPISPKMVDFRADTHENEEGEAILYKELRFKYKVLNGTGIFRKGIAPASEYFLVFQGKGNNCMFAEQFTHWRLEITGKTANYAFYGKLKTADK